MLQVTTTDCRTCMHAHTYTYTQTAGHACTHVHIYTHCRTCMHAYIYTVRHKTHSAGYRPHTRTLQDTVTTPGFCPGNRRGGGSAHAHPHLVTLARGWEPSGLLFHVSLLPVRVVGALAHLSLAPHTLAGEQALPVIPVGKLRHSRPAGIPEQGLLGGLWDKGWGVSSILPGLQRSPWAAGA